MEKHKNSWSTDPIGKNREIVWSFSVQSKLKNYMMEIFVPWNESNLVRLLSQIFSGRESVVKLFDFRILSTLLIRDIRIFILKGQAIKAVMVIALPLLLYLLNTRLIERNKSSYNLMKIFPAVQHLGARAKKENLLLVPHLFLFSSKVRRRYQRCLLNPKEHVWILSSSNTNLNQKNDRISEKQETISWESLSEKESNGIEWEIDSSFNSIPEYWKPETEPENLYEWQESILYLDRSKIIEEVENELEQLEEKLVEAEKEFALSSEPEEIKNIERKQKVQEVESCKEGLRRLKKLLREEKKKLQKLQEIDFEQEKILQEESDQARESFSFSESEVFQKLFEHSLIDESCISINYANANKPSEKFKLLKGQQDAFQYFRGLEKKRIVDLWKVKTFLQNPSVNYDILPNREWNIRKDINQFNCIRFMKSNLSSRSPSSCDQNKKQLAVNDDFQFKKFVLEITDQFTLSITKPNYHYYPHDEIDLDIDDRVNELHLLNQTLLKSFNYFFNYRDELTHDSFLRALNIFEKKKTSEDDNTKQLILNKILNRYKIQADEYVKIEKAFNRFDFFKNVLAPLVSKSDFTKYFQYFLKNENDLESFQKYSFLEYHKYYMELQRSSLELQKVLFKNKYYLKLQKYSLELQKVLFKNKYYLKLQKYSLELQKVLFRNKYYLKLQKVLNKYYLELDKAFHKYSLVFHEYSLELLTKYSLVFHEYSLEFHEYSLELLTKSSLIFHEYSLELQKILNNIKLESQKVLDEYYLELHNYLGYFYVEFQRVSLELQKVLNDNKYYSQFIDFIKTLSRNLNNVTQDAINQYSSSWIICQKDCLDRPTFRPVQIKNPNFLNTFILSKKIEYFQQRLEYLLSISKQNNFKKKVLDPIEFSIIQHWGWFGDPNQIHDTEIHRIISNNINCSKILWAKLNENVWDKLNENDIKSKSILNLECKPTLGLNEKKPIIEFIIDVFDNGKNYMELFELFNNAGLSEIFDNQDNWLNPLKLSNQNSLRASFYKANTFEFLDYLHRPRLFYKKRLASYMGRIHIKNKNVTYGQLLNLVFIPNNLVSSSISEMRAMYSEKETISLIKSQVNILLDKYLRDKVLIHDLHKSSNFFDKLNSIIRRNINFSIEDISKTPLISLQIVNFDKDSCYPFLKSVDLKEKTSSQYSKNSFSSNIDLIQTQSYQDDLLSEISLRMKKKEKSSSTESLKDIIEDKAIGDFMEDEAIGDFMEFKSLGDFFDKEKLKLVFSKLKVLISFNQNQINILFDQINILFEKWGLFQTHNSWLWFLTSTGWKYAKNMVLATFSEIEISINSINQLVSIPGNFRQNWNHNLNILWTLYHQFWKLLKWEFRDKIDQIITILNDQILKILNDQILPILNDQILPILNDQILPVFNLMLSRWNIDKLWQETNESILAEVLRGKDLSISFDTWKYIKNVREYDIFLYIFIGFSFYISSIIPLFLIQFYRNFYLIRVLESNSNCFKRVGELIRSYKMLRNFSNLNWYGSWLTFVDYIELDSDPDDIGLLLLLKIWYVKNIKWLHFIECWEYNSLIKTLLYEFEVDDFLLRENRLFLLEEKISQFESKLTPPIGLFHEFEKREQPGVLYFRYLAEFIQQGLTHRIGLMNSELNSLFLAEMPIFAAFYQKMTSIPSRVSLYDHVRFYPLYPVPSFSNRILLIGPKETGRSYLAKSLAADSYLPLIRISPKSFLRQQKLLSRYEPEYTSSAKQSYLEHENILRSLGWSGRPKEIDEKEYYDEKPHKILYDRVNNPNPPEYFSRRVIQFVFALKLAKLMSPCVIWIPSIHELNDYFYLIALLVELLGDPYNPIDGEKENTIKQNIVVIASTDIPKKIDPVLITPPRSKRRFDTFINTKKLPAPYREKEFPLLLRYKGLYLKKEWNCYDEFGLTTKGFTTRDLAKLADDIFRISMSQNTSAIDNDIIGVALYRLNWGPCNYDLKFSEFFKGLPYKIGKAIIQNKLTYLKNSIRLNLDFESRRAHYLHQWYLEPSIAGTVAKEFTVFYHILGCLAGSVAQDCWFLSESNKENWSRPFDPFIENDFILASSLLQGLLEEFPSLAIYRGNSDYLTIAPQFKKDTMQKGLSSILDEIVLSKELKNSYGEEQETPIVCDSRTWRFSFIRSNRFEHIKDITIENPLLDYLHLFGGFQERPTRLSSLYWKKFLMSGPDFRPLYAGKDDILERKTAAFWEAKLLYKKFQRMGIYQFDTEEYAMEFKPLNTPVICLARRFLWDPVSIRFLNKHSAFERRELFVPKELVKSIYLTYSSTRELNVSIKKTLKSILKRKKVRKIALGIKIQTNDDDLPLNIKMEEKENFENFKRFQEIGIRLRRVLPYPQSVISERWFREKTRDDKFKQRLLKGERENIDLLSNESLIYKTLSESYEYLSNLFFSNRMLFKQMIDTLLKTKWLSTNAIDCLLAEGLNKNKKA